MHAVDTYHDYLNELAMLLEDKDLLFGFGMMVYTVKTKTEHSTQKSIQICYWTRYHKNMADVRLLLKKDMNLLISMQRIFIMFCMSMSV